MKRSTYARRALLGTLLAGSTILTTGCSTGGFSLASMNPFANQTPASPGSPPGITEKIAATAGGARNQASTIGMTAKSAWGKTTGAVTGMFSGGQDAGDESALAPDPLRLDKPATVSPEVFVANGQLWESTGDFKKAMDSYVKALEQEPNNPPALTSIARLHFRQGNYPKAAEFFQKAIEQTPEDAGLYNDLGLTLSKLGNHALAAQTLERALQLAPGTSRYANNLASVRFEAGDTGSAFQVLTGNNKPAVAHFNMAYLHFKKGQINEARGHLSQAMLFESQAESDSAVKRAVDRSRDMLAQINGNLNPVAQATPQAAIAGLPPSASIQQTSQSQSSDASPHVAPAAPNVGIAGNAGSSPLNWNTQNTTKLPAGNVTTAPTVTPPTVTPPSMTPPSMTPPSMTPPSSATPQLTLPGASTTPTESPTPSVPFSLPPGFGG